MPAILPLRAILRMIRNPERHFKAIRRSDRLRGTSGRLLAAGYEVSLAAGG